jgi:hypothetical protein
VQAVSTSAGRTAPRLIQHKAEVWLLQPIAKSMASHAAVCRDVEGSCSAVPAAAAVQHAMKQPCCSAWWHRDSLLHCKHYELALLFALQAFWFYRFLSIVYDHIVNPGWFEQLQISSSWGNL